MPKSGKFPSDFLVITILIILQMIFVVFNIPSVLRAGLGFLFIAFIPGYILQTLLLDTGRVVYISMNRLILSVPLSLAISVLIGLLGYIIEPQSIIGIAQVFMLGVLDFFLIAITIIWRRKGKLKGFSNFIIFISVLFFLVTIFVVIYPTLLDL